MRNNTCVRKGRARSAGKRCEIVLRIPGPWKGPSELADALPEETELRRGRMVMPDGTRVSTQFMPPDDEFPGVFVAAGRGAVSDATRRAIEHYQVNACLVGPGGSLENARRMMRVGCALLEAGGYGVFLDTSAVAHDRETWFEMAASDDAYAALAAFVNVVRGEDELSSIGMHAFGLRDAGVAAPRSWGAGDDADVAEHLLHRFLGYLLMTEGDVADGALFGTDSAQANVREGPSLPFVARGAPGFNPWGRWRLEPRTGPRSSSTAAS